MNYYEHHIGDFTEATAHLTFVEDAAYSRMIRKYYSTERPLPADVKAVQRLVGARSKEEREAVESVLHEFFALQEDGWHQSRCDADIMKYRDGEPEREVKKANEDNRLKRHREERSRLFKVITDAGQHAPWNIGMSELRDMVKRITATEPETPVPPLPATAPATPATATQTPDTRHQTPDIKDKGAGTPTLQLRTPGADACLRMKAAGLQGVNPSHPKLLALLQAGITPDELAEAAADAAGKGKPFAYALATAEGRRRDAAVQPLPDKPGPTVPGPSGLDPELVRRAAEDAAWKPPSPEVKAMLAQTVARLKGATT